VITAALVIPRGLLVNSGNRCAGERVSIAQMREIRIRDSLSGQLQTLQPDADGSIGIYACGPTVYGRIHIGNARPYVVFCLLKRFLAHEGHKPKLVVNVTDINDKIYAAARESGVGSTELAAEMTRAYVEDTDRLGLGRPDEEPLASETIGEIVELIQALVGGGHAYESAGDVYFRVRSFDGYGKLSNRDPEDMDQGEEAGEAERKESSLDFALWKARKPDEDTAWESPWGDGRPGWHIECSAMAERFLGMEFAVHGGGSDLIFPHHENEIAQSEAARGRPLARLWMHNGMVEIEREKMSKSVGNIFQLSEALDRYGRETVVAYLASGHYRQPLRFSEEALEGARAGVERLRNFLRLHPDDGSEPDPALGVHREAFLEALADDFNTPRALAAAFDLVAEGHRESLPGAARTLAELLPLLGLESLLEQADAADPEVERLLAEREAARGDGDYGLADRIRDELAALGWEVRDLPEGPMLVRRG
jgi:cysteinyl-tRNA synthetase